MFELLDGLMVFRALENDMCARVIMATVDDFIEKSSKLCSMELHRHLHFVHALTNELSTDTRTKTTNSERDTHTLTHTHTMNRIT